MEPLTETVTVSARLTVRHHFAADDSDPRNLEALRLVLREWRRAEARERGEKESGTR